jgi:hypothetical protein
MRGLRSGLLTILRTYHRRQPALLPESPTLNPANAYRGLTGRL